VDPSGLISRLFLDAARPTPIRAEDRRAPVRPDQLRPPRTMCPGLARARLAWYAAARTLPIVEAPTDAQWAVVEADRQTSAYQQARAAYLTHLAICPACSRMLQDHPDNPERPK